MTNKKLFYDCTEEELIIELKELGEPKFRAKQILSWVYEKSVTNFDEMSNLSKALREKLKAYFTLELPPRPYTIESPSKDAVKFGFDLDGDIIESVILASNKRRTLCLSSQIGCALGCTFCETGKLGLKRNLTTGEIIMQLVAANVYLKEREERITNLVFMGMGEALSNFKNWQKALSTITSENCFGIGTRKITVSTAGVIPNIKKLIDNNVNIELAISLNSSNDTERSAVMPINDKYPIKELMAAAKEYYQFRGRPVTFEYVLIAGKNDSDDAADRLIKLFRNYPGKINVIPLNDCTTDGLSRPNEGRITAFTKRIHDAGITVTVRRSGGSEIDGACGQLAGKAKREQNG